MLKTAWLNQRITQPLKEDIIGLIPMGIELYYALPPVNGFKIVLF